MEGAEGLDRDHRPSGREDKLSVALGFGQGLEGLGPGEEIHGGSPFWLIWLVYPPWSVLRNSEGCQLPLLWYSVGHADLGELALGGVRAAQSAREVDR